MMGRTINIGASGFEEIRSHDDFYVDKSNFIKEWWEARDIVTLIARPRRFGKTLNMDMFDCFFSIKYAERSDLFEGLKIWEEEKYRSLQGTYPVLFLSFATVKTTDFENARRQMCGIIYNVFQDFRFLLDSDRLSDKDKAFFLSVDRDMNTADAADAIHNLCRWLTLYYGKKVIVLLDEYDTPMQEAWMNGYWKAMVSFLRSFFNATFKTNPYLERGLMTGVTRISKESIFSDMNNLKVVTTTSEKYMDCFGFTEEEVFDALTEMKLSNTMPEVKKWYDGFTFGTLRGIYNPWSIINYLDEKTLRPYWANTSGNGLISRLIREGTPEIKMTVEDLLHGKTLTCMIDEQIVFDQLDDSPEAVWSLFLASGYLKVVKPPRYGAEATVEDLTYELTLTNKEVHLMFDDLIRRWFRGDSGSYNQFVRSMLKGSLKEMNAYMNKMALSVFSYFDTGSRPSKDTEPERFYHGFVLGLLVDLQGRYVLTSNRESGYGRYDVMLEPLRSEDPAFLLEFKVHDPEDEKDLKGTVAVALQQIEEKQYADLLIEKGIQPERIRKYGFAFQGKKVLIG